MNIEFTNPEKKLVSLVSAIGRDPVSWRGWKSLMINLDNIAPDYEQDMFIWARAVFESSLKDTSARVFLSSKMGIHVICKNMSKEILAEIGRQISDMATDESGHDLSYKVYDLLHHADAYIQETLSKASESPVLIVENAIRKVDGDIMDFTGQQEMYQAQNIRNYHDYTKVLLVEDDPVTRWMVRNALKKCCTLTTAPTAHKAYDLYINFQPDIVFLDIGLPDESGKNVLEWILRNDPGACVVMFSSNDDLDNIAETLEDGASGFIPKPFLKDQLLHYINYYEKIAS
ncbi:MAG: response regulator [Rhodospirillales bacterium]|nr:response regulator [Rhodospirillales bacterium]MCB9973505.1 response regulator [Rhodospirillales bacterium]